MTGIGCVHMYLCQLFHELKVVSDNVVGRVVVERVGRVCHRSDLCSVVGEGQADEK